MNTNRRVIVITGMGGMGGAVARRLGSGATLVLADVNEEAIDEQASVLEATGNAVVRQPLDAGSKASVEKLAQVAASHGPVTGVVHTAGVSPVQASVEAILNVDLLGTAYMLDAFADVVAPGGAGVFIASMAGTFTRLPDELEAALVKTPTDQLADVPGLIEALGADSGTAYGVAKRANQLRILSASLSWGARSARVNSISPGVISTPMGAAELDGPSGEFMRSMIAGSGTGRIGTPEDIAQAVDYLLSPQASFITGTDLLVDGGVVASLQAQ